MPEGDLRQQRVDKLLAQDPEISDSELEEFRMQMDQSIELLEQKSKGTRRRILIALAIYLVGMVICWLSVLLWHGAATSATAGLVRGLLHWLFAVTAIVAALTGIWGAAVYVFKYAPQLSRARFDLQMSMMVELQQQVKQLREDMDRRNR